MPSEKELVRRIYALLKEADSKIAEADALMRMRKRDFEIEACNRDGGRAGWSRFRAQLMKYTETYGLQYLNMEDSE